MGIYRFLLSLVVILFHFGSVSVPSGYSVVFGFYLVSGYIITLVIDKTYLSKGSVSFYTNRFLKIVPLYIVYVLLTFIAIKLRNSSGFILNLNNTQDIFYLFPANIINYDFKDIMNEFSLDFFASKAPQKALALNGFPQLVPQSWSLCVEIIFYISAPFLVRMYKTKKVGKLLYFVLIPLMMIYPIVALIKGLDFPTYRYRSVFSTYFIFLIGSAIYFIKDKIPKLSKPNISFFILMLIYFYSVIFINNQKLIESQIYLVLIIQILIVVVSAQISLKGNFIMKLEKIMGKLSYGLFVGQFFSGFLLFAITEHFYLLSGIYVFGKPYSLIFGLNVVGLQIIISTITYFIVERPIEVIRTMVRGNKSEMSIESKSITAQ